MFCPLNMFHNSSKSSKLKEKPSLSLQLLVYWIVQDMQSKNMPGSENQTNVEASQQLNMECQSDNREEKMHTVHILLHWALKMLVWAPNSNDFMHRSSIQKAKKDLFKEM